MTTRLKPKWLDTTDSQLGDLLIADGYGGALVSNISIHEHNNFDLLDSYTQTEEDLENAVSYTHQHFNQELLDSYTETNVNLASAIQLMHSRNEDTGTTNAYFTLNSAIHPILLSCNMDEGKAHLTIYDTVEEAAAKVKVGTLITAQDFLHFGENICFFDSNPTPKIEVELTVEEDDIGNLSISSTYTASEIQALRDKCESLAEDVRALHSALTTYGLM